MNYPNGSLWKKGGTLVMLQQLTGELFCLLNVSGGGFSLEMDPVHTGKWQYSAEEIPERLEGFEPQAGHVSIAQPTQTPPQKKAPEPAKEKVKRGKS